MARASTQTTLSPGFSNIKVCEISIVAVDVQSIDNLERMRKFYRIYANRISALLMRISRDVKNSASTVRKTGNRIKQFVSVQMGRETKEALEQTSKEIGNILLN